MSILLDAILHSAVNPALSLLPPVAVDAPSLPIVVAGVTFNVEPAALRKPILFGPNMQNFQSIVEAFLRADAAVQVQDEQGLEQAFRKLLLDASTRDQLADRALKVVQENKGSIDRTVDMIVEQLKDQDIYVAPAPAI